MTRGNGSTAPHTGQHICPPSYLTVVMWLLILLTALVVGSFMRAYILGVCR